MHAPSLSVPLFIVLSGSCLALPLLRDGGLPGGWRGFFRQRAWRILPVYFTALTSVALPGSLAPALTYFLAERPGLRTRRCSPAPVEPVPTLDAVPQPSPGTLT